MNKIVLLTIVFLFAGISQAAATQGYANSITDPNKDCSQCHSDGRTWVAI